ncbi:hypothetical protein AAG570_006143 [Ranatra chinensis]|uniref:Helix-turn-helix domain-containing protein n=1 Tax=Ranatra chinensis TaxID=642074 RepID=A0ABD0XX61_9HEMI
MNSRHPMIKLTIELAGRLPSLGVLLKCKDNGALRHCIYRKPVHTHIYLNVTSHHHTAQKMSVMNSLVRRVIGISKEKSRTDDNRGLLKTLTSNGYEDTKKSIQKKGGISIDTRVMIEDDSIPSVCQDITDMFSRLLNKHDIVWRKVHSQ